MGSSASVVFKISNIKENESTLHIGESNSNAGDVPTIYAVSYDCGKIMCLK